MEVKCSAIRNAGLGVFATKNYEKDELIELSGYIKLKTKETPDTLLGHVFASQTDTEIWIYFGKMALVNHSTEENVYHCKTFDRILQFYARRNIKHGEEFLINYGKDTKF